MGMGEFSFPVMVGKAFQVSVPIEKLILEKYENNNWMLQNSRELKANTEANPGSQKGAQDTESAFALRVFVDPSKSEPSLRWP